MMSVFPALLRRFFGFAWVGALVLAIHAALRAAGVGELTVLDLFWLLAHGVIAPMALGLYAQARSDDHGPPAALRVVGWLYLPSLAGAVIALHLAPGTAGAALGVPWVVACALVLGYAVIHGLRRGVLPLAEFALDFSFVYLTLGAVFFVLYRNGTRLPGFNEEFAGLAHTHWVLAGFTALFLSGLGGRWLASRPGPARTLIALTSVTGIVGPLAVVGLLALHQETAAFALGLVMEGGYVVMGLVTAFAIGPRAAGRTARVLLVVAGLCVIAAMSLAAAYTIGRHRGDPLLTVEQMILSHGFLNGYGTAVLGLWGWMLAIGGDLVRARPIPPGQDGWPVLGETLRFARNPLVFLEARFRKYGPVFRTSVLGEPCVVLLGPEALTKLTDEKYFHRGGANPRNFRQLFSWNASALIDGPERARRKDILLQAFHKREAIDGYLALTQPMYEGFIARWERLGRFSWVPDHWEVGWQVASTLYLGATHEPPSSDVPLRPDPGKQVIDDLIAGFGAIPIALPFTKYGKALRGLRDARALIAAAAERRAREPERADAMKWLLAAKDEHGQGLSMHDLQTEVVQLFHLSFLTLPGVLNPMVMAIALFPEVRARLVAEIRAEAQTGPVTLDVLFRMPYLLRFVREVRRFYPLVANTLFTRVQHPVEIGGYHIPAGWRAIGALHTSMTDERAFPSPEKFDPDRFAPPRSEGDRENAYVPHGPGRPERSHKCPGEPWSDAFLAMCTVLLLREHEWELPPQDLELDTSNILAVPTQKSGLVAVFKRIKP